MKVRMSVEIESGNAAFGEDAADARRELLRIVKEAVPPLIQRTLLDEAEELPLRDVNGNRVGWFWCLIEED